MTPNNLVRRTGARVGNPRPQELAHPQAPDVGPLFAAGDASSHLQSALEAVFGSKTSSVITDLSRFKRDMQAAPWQLHRETPFCQHFLEALQFVDGPGGLCVQLRPGGATAITQHHFEEIDITHYEEEVAFYLQKVLTPVEQKALLDAITGKNNMRLRRDAEIAVLVVLVAIMLGWFLGMYSDMPPQMLLFAASLVYWIQTAHDSYKAQTRSCGELWKGLLESRLGDRLLQAVKSKDVPACRRLVEHLGGALFHQESGQSALGEAFRKHLGACLEAAWLRALNTDDAAVCQLFVEAGVDVNAKDNGGNLPLERAVLHQDVVRCRFLLAAGADMMACVGTQGDPIWFQALRQEHGELRQVFLEAAVDVNVKLILAAYCKRTEEFIEALCLGADVEALKDSLGLSYGTIKDEVKEFLATIPKSMLKHLHDEFSVALDPYLIPDLADLVFAYVHTPL